MDSSEEEGEGGAELNGDVNGAEDDVEDDGEPVGSSGRSVEKAEGVGFCALVTMPLDELGVGSRGVSDSLTT